MNNIALVGRLTNDPQKKEIGSGSVVCEFSIAVKKYGKEEADFFNIKAWGRTAEFCSNYLTKGRLVSVNGRMESRKYEKDGRTNVYWDVVASDVNGLDKPKQDDDMDQTREMVRQFKPRNYKEPAPPPPLPGELDLDDPFA